MKLDTPPYISVLMPVFNTEKFLVDSIESILKQTLSDFEFIIVDDGSTDRSLDILRYFETRDPRVRLICRNNRGLVKTRNELLEEAKGDVVVWADSDDISYPNRLECLIGLFRIDDALVWAGSAYRLIDPEGWPICVMGDPDSFGVGTAAMLRQMAIDVGGFREGLLVAEDTDIGLRMQERGKITYLNEPLIDYRQHLGSVSNSFRQVVKAYATRVSQLAEERRKFGKDALHRGEDLEGIQPGIAHRPEPEWQTYSRWAWWALRAGNIVTARKYALLAVRRKPISKDTWKVLACSIRGH